MIVRATVGSLAVLAALVLPSAGTALPAPGNSPLAGPSSPDIQRVTVVRDTSGRLTFRISLGAPAQLHATRVQVMLDVDKDSTTGIQGSDYALDWSIPAGGGAPYASVLALRDWQIVETRPPSLRFARTGSSITFGISSAAIGARGSFDFSVFLARADTIVDVSPAQAAAAAAPLVWTFPRGAAELSYSDTTQGSFSAGELAIVVGVLAGLGAAVLLIGLRRSRKPAEELAAAEIPRAVPPRRRPRRRQHVRNERRRPRQRV